MSINILSFSSSKESEQVMRYVWQSSDSY